MEWGFDLTDFSTSDNFKKLLKRNGLSSYKRRSKEGLMGGDSYYEYHWSGSGIRLITGNNPITGEFSSPKRRGREKGYASYMGIVGTESKVRKLVADIRKSATMIKGESPGSRDFI